MRVTSSQLLRTISLTLEKHVLPEVAGATWTASYVRSCLMLLAHLEARVERDAELLEEGNADLRSLLAKAGEATIVGINDTTQDRLGQLLDESEALGKALNAVIERAYGSERDLLPRIRDDLAAYRARSVERDERLFGRALGMSPL